MPIRVAVIGAGVMGSDHARIVASQIPDARLQVVCDADHARARAVAAETGAVRSASDPRDAIMSDDVDAVLIASPDATHGALTIACVEAGKPVLCEKPLAPTSAECLRVIEAESRAGKRLVQVGFMRRFDPAYVEMRSTLKRGALGSALMFHCFHRNVSAPPFFDFKMAITNSAPHEFDIARFVLDTDYASISVFRPRATDVTRPGAPVFMIAETVTGQLVTIEINNNAAYGYDVRGELVGEKGSVSLRSPVHIEINHNLCQGTAYPEDWRPPFAEAYRLQNQAWIHSIKTGVPAGSSAWDGYAATLVAEAGLAALAKGSTVNVSPAVKPSLYI